MCSGSRPVGLRSRWRLTPTSELCEQLSRWLEQYPATEAEDAALMACEQADEPALELVTAVLETHPLVMPSTRREVRFACVETDAWPTTRHRMIELLSNLAMSSHCAT